MEFKTPCHSCGQNIAFPVGAIGLQTNCPHCGQTTTLTAPTAAAATPPRKQNTITIGGTVYQVAQINSVRVEGGQTSIIALLLTVIFAPAAVGPLLLGEGDLVNRMVFALIPGIIALCAAIHFWQRLNTKRLILTTSSGEVAAKSSTNRAELDALATGIVTLISAR